MAENVPLSAGTSTKSFRQRSYFSFKGCHGNLSPRYTKIRPQGITAIMKFAMKMGRAERPEFSTFRPHDVVQSIKTRSGPYLNLFLSMSWGVKSLFLAKDTILRDFHSIWDFSH